jgi:hypothetical protein
MPVLGVVNRGAEQPDQQVLVNDIVNLALLPNGHIFLVQLGTLDDIGNDTQTSAKVMANTVSLIQLEEHTIPLPSLSAGVKMDKGQPTNELYPATIRQAYANSLLPRGQGGPYTFAVTAGALPAGLTLSADGNITGTPTQVTDRAAFTITVTDRVGRQGSLSYIMQVTGYDIIISSTDLASSDSPIHVGTELHRILTVTFDGLLSVGTGPVTFTVTSGNLPPGVTLTSDGVLSGTVSALGQYTFTVTATDAAGESGSMRSGVDVEPFPLTITPDVQSLPDGQAGQPYRVQFTATGAPGPYTWSAGDDLQQVFGLTLSPDGVLSGTPPLFSGSGGSFYVSVTSPTGAGTRLYNLSVNIQDSVSPPTLPSVAPPVPPIVSPAVPPTVSSATPPVPAPVVVPSDVMAVFTGLGSNPRVTTADVNGDGTPDYIGVSGPGTSNQLQVLDGKTKQVLAAFAPFESSFTGGLYVAAADLNGDGTAEVIATPDQGGGPVVAVYDGAKLAAGATGDAAQIVRFLGIDDPNFRGGARPALGTMSGIPALVIAAGFGGGPRVAVFNGRDVGAGSGDPGRLMPDFFAFEDSLRNGAYVSAGDLNGDGTADLAFGGGPGGAPRVRVIDGKGLLAAAGSFSTLDQIGQTQLANFFTGDPNARDGVRVTMRDVFGDGKTDLATEGGSGGTVHVYEPANLLTNSGSPSPDQDMDPLNGAFVG